MKDFIKYVLATITGLVVMGLLISISSVLTLMGIAMQDGAKPVPDDAVLVIKLDGTIVERAEENPFAELLGNSANAETGLDDLLAAVRKAKENDKVKGIYLEGGSFVGANPATLEEFRSALVDFKKSGKFIVSYADTYTQGTYYICSVADSVIVNPQGMLDWKGLSMQTMYFKDLMDKVGVKMQVFKVGTYKSAVEPFLLSEMSDANREQITVFSGELWSAMVKAVGASRKLSADKLNALADSSMIFCDPKTYLKEKLVDKLAFSDEVPQIIANMMGVEDKDAYSTVTVTDMAAADGNEPKDPSGDIIAVYYAFGDIVQEPSSGYSNSAEIAAANVIRDLEKLADDEDVKAVVLRVNSGGGSAYASEQIWHQVMNIKSKKPIIVSMGGLAASGGYYISCAADWIVAEPTTLTGSIGIFGMFPDASELFNDKLGLHFETVNTNKYADMGDFSRPMTPGEMSIMQSYVNRGYELFTKRCADGRKMEQDKIKEIAEGRVWTGVHAKELGLVDQLGGIDCAIDVAKKKAKLENCTVMSYPAKSNIFDQLMEGVSSDSYADAKLRENFGEYYNMFTTVKRISENSGVQAAMPYRFTFNL